MKFRINFPKFLRKSKPNTISESDLAFTKKIIRVVNFPIGNIRFYKEAFTLKSSSKQQKGNYERLEFLGDSILGAIIANYLFAEYPDGNEGFLTQMRSKIVNRKNLNKIGKELGLSSLIINQNATTHLSENLSGNLFEAFIGALYLDLGYDACRDLVLNKFLTQQSIKNLEGKIVSYKSLLLEWSQKKKCTIKYETSEELYPNKTTVFRTVVWLEGANIANASESNKKKAEEKAAQRAFYHLYKKENLVGKPDYI